MKRIITFSALAFFSFQQLQAQENYLWATGSTVGSYYNAANYYTNNYMNPWPYSRSSMIPIVVGNEVTWRNIESSIASQLRSTGVKTDGTIWFWTKNSDPTKSSEPVQFGTDTDWKQGAIANASAYGGYQGLKNNGTLWYWLNAGSTPVQWGTDSDWDTIVGWTADVMVAIKTNGTLWKLETGTDGQPGSMTQFGTDTDWLTAKVTSNGTFNYAIKTNGTLWKFNTTTNQFEQDGTDTNWKDITENGSIAIKSNGTIWGIGFNNDGQLGLGNTNTVYEWTQIGTDTDWKQVSARNATTYALKSDSTLWAWGDNSAYQLANGTNTDLYVPTQVGQDHSWLYVSATTLGAFALRTFGYEGPGSSTAGINPLISDALTIYPNPGTSSVVLNMNTGWNGFLVAFAGVDGKEIALTAVQKSANELEFNTDSLVPGVYFIRLTSTEGNALVRWVKN
jgi:alpha-tubulin suppressor-like RCC1 family protein